MIPHALFRNTIIPLTLTTYTIYHYTGNKHIETIIRYTSWLIIYLIPGYITAAILGLNPVNWVISFGWRNPQSPIQYLLYVSITKHILYLKTRNFPQSFTLAVISAGAAGYLYEIPYWLQNNIDIIRTAYYSPIILDFGMISALILISAIFLNHLAYPKLFLITLGTYFGYCYIYYYHYTFMIKILKALLPILPVAVRRVPAMLLTLCACLHQKPLTKQGDNQPD